MNTEITSIAFKLRAFAKERDWEQYHSPKNLASALVVEAAELLEIFQWLSPEQSESLSDAHRQRVRDELADVFNYVVRLSDLLEIDLIEASDQKIKENASKYPADIVRGSAKKYTEYPDE